MDTGGLNNQNNYENSSNGQSKDVIHVTLEAASMQQLIKLS